MAEPSTPPAPRANTPALPSTADTVPYVPVSWMAVAAAGVAAVFLLILLVSGYDAYRNKRPLTTEWILIFPIVAVVLSFAARRLIRNSEGTRTGELFGANLPVAAWWVGLVGALGYGTYLLAIDFSIRRDAETEVAKWVETLTKAEDPSTPDPIDVAFLRTLEPARRGSFARINDRAELRRQLEANFRDPLLTFRQTDIIRIVERNRGLCVFVPGGLRDWKYQEAGIECVYTGAIKCPEGTFPLSIALRGVEVGTGSESGVVGRQWQVVPSPSGFVQRERITLTPYGWLVALVEQQGAAFAHQIISTAATAGPPVRPYLYRDLVAGGKETPLTPEQEVALTTRAAAAGGPIYSHPRTPTYEKWLLETAFRLPGGGEPPAAIRDQFLKVWNEEQGIIPSGSVLRNTPDPTPTLTITPTAVQLRFPLEIPFRDGSAARGRLVIESIDPGLPAELQELRRSADPDKGTTNPPTELQNRMIRWRVLRIESDMYPIKPQPQGGPGGAPPGGSLGH